MVGNAGIVQESRCVPEQVPDHSNDLKVLSDVSASTKTLAKVRVFAVPAGNLSPDCPQRKVEVALVEAICLWLMGHVLNCDIGCRGLACELDSHISDVRTNSGRSICLLEWIFACAKDTFSRTVRFTQAEV